MAKPTITSAIQSPPRDSQDQVRRAHQRRLVYELVFGVLVVLVLYLLAH